MFTMYELSPVNGRKSFYGKMNVIKTDNGLFCKSYDTIVASYVNGKFKRHWSGWSATSASHINSFAVHVGVPQMNKAEWSKLPVVSCRL